MSADADTYSDKNPGIYEGRNALEVKNLTKEYKDFKLDHISFELPQGCIMGLVGENGAGKSTTIKLIMDTIERNDGEILIFGKDNRSNFKITKEDIGIVLDETGFPDVVTSKDVNKIMKSVYRNWDEEIFSGYMRRFGLSDTKKFKEYSRGMKMKLSIAVAMSHHARLLILDEATSGLDPIVRDEILDLFLEFTREENHSILISSHIVSDLEKLCDYITFLHKGKLIFCKEKDRLLEEYGILHCTGEQAAALSQDAVAGRRDNNYGAELLVVRSQIPAAMVVERATIEDIILFMAKRGEKR